MPLESLTCKKMYSAPRLNKLTPEQAQLLLLGHATCGDQGAKDLLDVIYPAFEPQGNDDVLADLADGGSALMTPRMPSVIRRVFAAIGRTRDNFHRLVRG